MRKRKQKCDSLCPGTSLSLSWMTPPSSHGSIMSFQLGDVTSRMDAGGFRQSLAADSR